MRKAWIALALVLIPIVISAQTKSFYVHGEDGRDLVTFTSKAPMETVEGKTSSIKGFLKVHPGNIDIAEAKFVVDLVSLKTGISLRDQHMRENHLETDTYPEAIFTLIKVISENGFDISSGESKDVTLQGDFTCHGITKSVEVNASVQYFTDQASCPENLPGESIHVTANFDVYLADYEIKRPKFLVLKLDEKQAITLDFWVSTELPEVVFAEK